MRRILALICAAFCITSLLCSCKNAATTTGGKLIDVPNENSYPFYASWITERSSLKTEDESWRVGAVVGNSIKIISGATGAPGVCYAKELPSRFAFTTTASFADVEGAAALKVSFGQDKTNPYLTVQLSKDANENVFVSLFCGEKELCSSKAYKSSATEYKLILDNSLGNGCVQLHMTGGKNVSYHVEIDQLEQALLGSLSHFYLSADAARISLTDTGVDNAPYQVGDMKKYATAAMNDVIRNFWYGDLETGMLRGGYGGSSLFVMSLYNYYLLSQDSVCKSIFERQEYQLIHGYDPNQVKVAGTSTTPAGDDQGYFCLYNMFWYRVTKNPEVLEYAKALFDSIFIKYWDDVYGGGLWYNQGGSSGGGTGSSAALPRFKSVYSVSTVMAGFEYFDATGDKEVFDKAAAEYEWMATHLNEGRNDGLYFAEYTDAGAGNGGSADHISAAGSSTFLGGNMGMAVCSYKMYKYTDEQKYLDRTMATLEGILTREVKDGLFLCDRDPVTGASFMGYLVEMLIEMDQQGIDNGYLERYVLPFYATASLIYTNNRTEEGFYNGAWYYLEEGEKSYADMGGNTADLITVTGNSTHVITAAALLEDYLVSQ